MKDLLYEVLKDNVLRTVEVLRKNGGYPDIMHTKKDAFIDGLIFLIDEYTAKIGYHEKFHVLREVIEGGKQKKTLDFIQDEVKNVWVGDYSQFYVQQMIKFCCKRLIFDENNKAKQKLCDICYKGRSVDWKMVDSKQNKMVQISDLVVGFVRKFLMFVNRDCGVIIKDLDAFTDLQWSNFGLMVDVLHSSMLYNPLFVEYCASRKFVERVNWLLQNVPCIKCYNH